MRRCEYCDSPVPADATVCPVCRETIAEETLERILPLLKRPEAPEVRSMGPIERLWGVLRRPAPTYRDIGQRPDMAGPMIVIIMNALVIVGIFLAISSKLMVDTWVGNSTVGYWAEVSVLSSEHSQLFLMTGLATALPNILLGILFLIIGTVFAHLAFKITGGTGTRGKTASIVGYSVFPVVIMRLIAILIILIAMPTFSVTGFSETVVDQAITLVFNAGWWLTIDYMTTISFVWVGFLLIFGIREAHDTSTEWAVIVSILCMIVLTWTFWQAH